MSNTAFRPCVLAVFTNEAGLVLVGERVQPPGAWQFPQGGVDAGENVETALFREMREELGCDDFDILKRLETPIRYRFPEDMVAPLTARYQGQDQTWFLLRFREGAGPDLSRAVDQEFSAFNWVTAEEALAMVVDFKKEAYKAGLTALGLVRR